MFVAAAGVAFFVLVCLIALVIWFGVGFLLGGTMKYRWALEVAAWSQLVAIPAVVISSALAWIRSSSDVSIGFGVLLGNPDSPGRLVAGLRVFLDAVGPFEIWHVAVAVLGAAALAGKSRKSVAWVLGGFYGVVTLVRAVLASLGASPA